MWYYKYDIVYYVIRYCYMVSQFSGIPYSGFWKLGRTIWPRISYCGMIWRYDIFGSVFGASRLRQSTFGIWYFIWYFTFWNMVFLLVGGISGIIWYSGFCNMVFWRNMILEYHILKLTKYHIPEMPCSEARIWG